MADLAKIAAVFDAMAEYVDANEREKTAVVENARKSRIDKIAAAHVATHGEEMPEAVRQKLAKADDAALEYVEDLLSKQGGVIEPLGAGALPELDTNHKTVKEAADAADDRFLSWITS